MMATSDPVSSLPPITSPSVTPLAMDLLSPLIMVCHINDGAWKEHMDLDLSLANWTTWSCQVLLVLQIFSELDMYLCGKVAEPDPHFELQAHCNWHINDSAVHAFILSHCSPTKYSHIETLKMALKMWSTLETRHKC